MIEMRPLGRRFVSPKSPKSPYMIIIGEKEEENQTVSLRKHSEGDLGSFSTESLVELINTE